MFFQSDDVKSKTDVHVWLWAKKITLMLLLNIFLICCIFIKVNKNVFLFFIYLFISLSTLQKRIVYSELQMVLNYLNGCRDKMQTLHFSEIKRFAFISEKKSIVHTMYIWLML